MSCTECEYSQFPVVYDDRRRIFAIVVASISLVVILGAVVLLWLRRHSRLMLIRDPWLAMLVVFYTILSLDTAYREYFGEVQMLCSVFYVENYAKSALIPMVTLVRCVGLYARHLRQNEAIGPTGTSVLPRTTSSIWRKNIETWLLRNRMDSPFQLRLIVAWGALPWVLYYVIRLAADDKYHSGKVGCRFDVMDAVLSILAGVIVASGMLPVLAALRHLADSLLLRREILTQLVAWIPLMGWFLYGTASSSFDIEIVNSAYAILFGNVVALVASVWLPALASFAESQPTPSHLYATTCSEQVDDRYMAEILAHGMAPETSTDLELPVLSAPSDAGIHSATVLSDSSSIRDKTATMNAVAMHLDEPGGTRTSNSAAAFACTEGPIAVDGDGEEKPHETVDSLAGSSAVPPRTISSRISTQSWRYSTDPTVPIAVSVVGSIPPGNTGSAGEDAVPLHPRWDYPRAFRAKQLIDPRPTRDEVVSLLSQPAQTTLTSARSLRLFGWLLICCDSGRALLEDTLKREFCAELLGFLLACADVWAAARDITSPDRQYNADLEPNHVPANQPSPCQLDTRVGLDTLSSAAFTFRSLRDWSTLVAAYSRLLVQYVVPDAPNQVNLAAAQVQRLNAAAAALAHQRSRPFSYVSIESESQSVLQAALQAVWYAESETFRLLIAGPVYRLARNPAQYAAAVASLASDLGSSLTDPVPGLRLRTPPDAT